MRSTLASLAGCRVLSRAAQRAAAPSVGPLQDTGQEAVQTDIANLQAALAGVQAEEAFVPAVAVGTVEHWIANEADAYCAWRFSHRAATPMGLRARCWQRETAVVFPMDQRYNTV